MRLTVGTFLQLFFLCVERGTNKKEEVFNVFFSPFDLEYDKAARSRIMQCHSYLAQRCYRCLNKFAYMLLYWKPITRLAKEKDNYKL